MSKSPKVLSLPPHISVAWDEVSSIEVVEGILHVHLKSNRSHKVPNLTEETIRSVFAQHASHLETPETTAPMMSFDNTLGFSKELDGMSMPMQHNPEQKNAPDMPKEVLDKIVAVTQALGIEQQVVELPPAEPHCNCFYCQISRALHHENGESLVQAPKEEVIEVSDDDLKFRDDWMVRPVENSTDVYTVVNPDNEQEQYSVYLGEPIGCTCGEKNCMHVRSVLNS